MPTTPQTVPLPERASLEQLKKRAKDLQRAVRSQQPTAMGSSRGTRPRVGIRWSNSPSTPRSW
ncbi:hypothetical protein N4G69_39360 [Streptomyces mirabilis]|uniref:hypothetical protein n=1 Tax=Streptomyces mirabilis TaxID=68239 RepID=UPI0021C2406F|nr:hypothetical protein [Streptomyces mirabilis]MCT9111582.1 hypothetical protein [Streptomyces mirabilis]